MRDTLDDLSAVAVTSQLAQPQLRRALFGLLTRRERWALSWRGRLILATAFLLLLAVCIKRVYPYLAITDPVNANILVVEGWIHEYAIRAALREFQSNHYERVFTTVGPVEGAATAEQGRDRGGLVRAAGFPFATEVPIKRSTYCRGG